MTFPWGSDSVDSAGSLAAEAKAGALHAGPGESRRKIMCSDRPHAILIAARARHHHTLNSSELPEYSPRSYLQVHSTEARLGFPKGEALAQVPWQTSREQAC